MAKLDSQDKHHFSNEDNIYKKLYNGIMSSIPSSIVIVDSQLRTVAANPNFYIKSHQSESDTLGKTITEIFPRVLINYTKIPDRIREVFKSSESYEGGEMEYRAPGLPTRVYYYRLTPLLNSSGEVESVILLMDDVTERKLLGEKIRQTEEHLARVVDSANDIIISTDPAGDIVSWNNTVEEITGIYSQEVIGKSFVGLIEKKCRNKFREIVNQLVRGLQVKSQEFPIVCFDEESVDVSWSFSAMKDDQEKVISLVIVGRDLTERKVLEARLMQSAKMASLGTMAGGIAHEVRNPLAIIDSVAQILKSGCGSKKLHNECVTKIRNATTRAAEIVDNLLVFARPAEVRHEKLNVHHLINDVLSLMQNQLAIQHIETQKNFASELPKVYGNRNQIQQVFINLILNACNAILESGTIFIKTYNTKHYVIIEFEDTGKGIQKKNLSQIFDPFFTTQPVGSGTGLGLSISYRIIEQHQGNIEVKSKHGKGSVFLVNLPINTGSSSKEQP